MNEYSTRRRLEFKSENNVALTAPRPTPPRAQVVACGFMKTLQSILRPSYTVARHEIEKIRRCDVRSGGFFYE